eukprot:c10360_g4_i1 orf=289-549(+)
MTIHSLNGLDSEDKVAMHPSAITINHFAIDSEWLLILQSASTVFCEPLTTTSRSTIWQFTGRRCMDLIVENIFSRHEGGGNGHGEA